MKPNRRVWVWIIAAAAAALLLVRLLRPSPVTVDVAAAETGPLMVTVGDEGMTRVRDRYLVTAPVSGRVGRRNAEIGMLADPSTVLFEIGNFKKVIVEVPLTGEMLRHIKAGQPALISSPVLGPEPLRATLSRISPFLAAGSLSTVGEVDVANTGERLQPGMFVTVAPPTVALSLRAMVTLSGTPLLALTMPPTRQPPVQKPSPGIR